MTKYTQGLCLVVRCLLHVANKSSLAHVCNVERLTAKLSLLSGFCSFCCTSVWVS